MGYGYGPRMAGDDAFAAFAARLDEPVYIVTVAHAGTRAGCLIGFGEQVSIDPPRFLACLSDKNHTYRVAARGAGHLGVHLIPADRPDLAALFGGETGDEVDKFTRCAWHEGPHGVPLLDECGNWFVGRVLTRVDAGDHDAFLLEPVAAEAEPQADFTFHRAKRIVPGHEA